MDEQLITSVNNNTIKRIRALRQRRERLEQGRFLVEGIRIVAEAVQTGADVEYLVVAPELLISEFAQQLVRDAAVPQLQVSSQVFARLSSKDGPQGLAAVIKQHWESLNQLVPQAGELWVALDAPQDPGNLGTIMRTADAVGAAGLILIGNSADPFDPGAVRASMGSLFALRLVQTDISSFLRWTAQTQIPVVGTAGAAAVHYRQVDYHLPLVLLSGSERQGLPEQLMNACQHLVSIPMVGRCDSLNLAVATSIVLYEIYEQVNR
jgi:TrmH family RNA methyltransferase